MFGGRKADTGMKAAPDPTAATSRAETGQRQSRLFSYVMVGILVAGAAGVSGFLHPLLPPTGLPMIFLVAVLASAATFGLWPGIAAAALAFATYNFFFVEPRHTFRVSSAEDVLNLSMFVFAAGLTGWLAGRARDEAVAAKHRATQLGELAAFSAKLADCTSVDAVLSSLVRHIHRITETPAIVLRQGKDGIVNAFSVPAGVELDDFDLQSCEQAFRRAKVQPAVASGWQGSRFAFYPVMAAEKVHAVSGALVPDASRSRAAETDRTIGTMVTQASGAIERIMQAKTVEAERVRAEQESLRATLLLSLSHDLRTPLATILGSVTSLRQLGNVLSQAARDDLLSATEEETRQLSRYVDDLLTMTKLNVGLRPHLEWADPADVVQGAVERARKSHPGRRIVASLADSLPLVITDASLLEQALLNLLDNAAKFSPPDAPVKIAAHGADGSLVFDVVDEGNGVPPQIAEKVFDPLFRASDTDKGGTGLGLAIVAGIASILGGTVNLESPLGAAGGSRFRLSLPLLGKAAN